MHQHPNNTTNYRRRCARRLLIALRRGKGPRGERMHPAAWLLLLILAAHAARAQDALLPMPVPGTGTAKAPAQTAPQLRTVTIADAVSIFLQQNLQIVAARYDVDIVEAEKLTAKLRPDPQLSVSAADIPLVFSPSVFKPQTYDYGVSQTFELGGKRQKRIDAANADSALAHAQFETVMWQMTNDVKRKFYTVLLARSQLELSRENQKTFGEIVDRTNEVFKLGEISGLDVQRLEVEKFKFDTDVANSERDYELALRDLRFSLGGDYKAMDVEVAGAIDYYQTYDLLLSDLRDKALAARPDLKAAKLSETAADASIRLQNAQRIPDVTVGAGIEQVPAGGSTYNVGFSVPIPIFNHNQEERAKAQIQKMKAQNDQLQLTNQVLSDVDKAFVAVEIQKRRVDLYKNGVLTKVNNIQTLTEFSLKAGESSILELLDAIRTRRDTLSGFYQTIFDYQMSLLDLELATATPLPK